MYTHNMLTNVKNFSISTQKGKSNRLLGTVQKLLVISTPYKCSAAKKKIAGIGNKGIKGNVLCQDLLMPQMDI